ncbi:hypothetical protein CGRA01v4_00824 [Colletotrichum graminicola]|nr:hypothetical protein CGRA01v4_00824 [Colletotrichum graminicola]
MLCRASRRQSGQTLPSRRACVRASWRCGQAHQKPIALCYELIGVGRDGNSQGFSWSRQVAIGERLAPRVRRQSHQPFGPDVC